MDPDGFMDGLEIAQVLPGPNILNLAIYCGQKVRGVPGAIAAFLGASVPPFVIVLIAGALYFKFAANPFVQGALRGCAAGALGLTIGNALELTWDERASWSRIALLVVTALTVSFLRMPLLLVLVLFGGAGIVHEYAADAQARTAVNASLQTLLHLLWTFAQLSVLGFGGGKGIIPQMHADAVTHYHWVTSQQFTQFYTIGKLVPGPTTIFAALIGYAATPGRPLLGAAVATLGMFVPSSAIMVGFDAVWLRFEASPWRAMISHGLRPAIVGLGLVQRLDDRARRRRRRRRLCRSRRSSPF